MMNELMNGGANFQFPVINIFIVDKLTLSGVRFKVGVEGTVLCGKSGGRGIYWGRPFNEMRYINWILLHFPLSRIDRIPRDLRKKTMDERCVAELRDAAL